jgi:hypothetical protein
MPVEKGGTWHADLRHRLADRLVRLLENRDDLALPGGGVTHGDVA